MSDSKISFHPTVGLDRGESRGCVAARCLFFFACVMTSSWGVDPGGGKLKGTESREEKKEEKETQFAIRKQERDEQLAVR